MELKKHAKSASDYNNSFYILIGSYAVLAIYIIIYNIILSKSGIIYDNHAQEAYFNLSQLPPSLDENEVFLPPAPPPPPAQENIDIPVIVETDSIIQKDTVAETEVENETVDTGDNSNSEATNGETNESGESGNGDPGNIYFIVDKMPEYPGGDFALRRYIAENIKYPPLAHKNGIRGIVYIKFCVTSAGDVEKAEIVRGVHPLLDQEALRVVQTLPKWAPGERKGRKVSVWYSVPINFQLN